MEDEEVFQAVREINKLMHEAKVKTNIANKALKDAEAVSYTHLRAHET